MSALIQQTEEWIEFRKNHIGASDAPVIMKVSPWKTPLQLWEEKMGISKSKEVTDSMKRGIDLEPKAREKFKEKTGIAFEPSVILHPKLKWMMASLDGINDQNKSILEIKCVNQEDHRLAIGKKIPEKYFPQLQHQLEVSGYDHGYYFSFDGEDGEIVEFERDNKYIESLIEEEKEFHKCMVSFLSPDLTERDFVHPDDLESWKKATEEWESLQPYVKREQHLKETISSLANGKNVSYNGYRVTQVTRKGNIDYASIAEIKKIDLEKYRKSPVTFSKLTREK